MIVYTMQHAVTIGLHDSPILVEGVFSTLELAQAHALKLNGNELSWKGLTNDNPNFKGKVSQWEAVMTGWYHPVVIHIEMCKLDSPNIPFGD